MRSLPQRRGYTGRGRARNRETPEIYSGFYWLLLRPIVRQSREIGRLPGRKQHILGRRTCPRSESSYTAVTPAVGRRWGRGCGVCAVGSLLYLFDKFRPLFDVACVELRW